GVPSRYTCARLAAPAASSRTWTSCHFPVLTVVVLVVVVALTSLRRASLSALEVDRVASAVPPEVRKRTRLTLLAPWLRTLKRSRTNTSGRDTGSLKYAYAALPVLVARPPRAPE